MAEPSVAPQVLAALSKLREAVRDSPPHRLATIYPALCELAGWALARLMPVPVSAPETVTEGPDEALTAGRLRDRWISPRECALRLNISLRTLRRRARLPPYSGFCILQDHGFKVSEMGLDEHMRRERERARR
jgi:hypothetical protein